MPLIIGFIVFVAIIYFAFAHKEGLTNAQKLKRFSIIALILIGLAVLSDYLNLF